MHKRGNPPKEHVAEKPTKKINAPLTEVPNDWERKILRGPLDSRLAAIKEAGELRDVKAVPAIYKATRDHDGDEYIFILDAALEAMGKIGQGALEYLLGMIEQGDPHPSDTSIYIREMLVGHPENFAGATPAVIRTFERVVDGITAGPHVTAGIEKLATILGKTKDARAIKPLETAMVVLLANSKHSDGQNEVTASINELCLYRGIASIKAALVELGVSEDRIKQLTAMAGLKHDGINRGKSFDDWIRQISKEAVEAGHNPDDKTDSEN